MNHRRVRDLRFYMEYEYSSETKDMIEDLLTKYPDADDILTKAIAALHEKHFGAISTKTPPPTYSQTFSGNSDTADKRIDELWHFVQSVKELQTTPQKVATNNKNQNHFSDESNEKILEKIDELGMSFKKIVSEADKVTGKKAITADMSKEEVLQLIKRIDQLESKLTRAISESRVAAAAAPSRIGGRQLRDLGDAPKIGAAQPIDKTAAESEDRPLLEDVLDTIIVSVEKEDE
ncbi:MAG: hypothetical protein FK733_08365 [Asgard group archaeon]|nr:hypothetical protein [Asgard group archaeon]